MRWFRMYDEAIDDEKLRLLAFEDRWHFVALLCCKSKGILDADEPIQLRKRKLSVKLGLQIVELENAQKRLQELGLIDSNFNPVAWSHRQYESDSSTERVRKFRAKHNETLPKRFSNGAETETETEADTETEKPLVKTDKPVLPICPVTEIISLYHETLPTLPKVVVRNKGRDGNISARWRQFYEAGDFTDRAGGLDCFAWFFGEVKKSKFLMGQVQGKDGKAPFIADLGWLTKPENFTKVIEGRYVR